MLTLTHASDTYKSIMSQSEPSTKVLDWLCKLRLERYTEAFQSAGMATLQECLNLTPDQLDRMGITLPGHQRRILASLNNLHYAHDTQSEHAEVVRKETPVCLSVGGENLDRDKQAGETRRPTPRQRGKPVPKQRCMSKMQNSEEGETKPVPGKRSTVTCEIKEDERNEGKEKPVPKQRTKFCTSSPVHCQSGSFVPPSSDTSLPPVPPRINNCPPQRFSTSQSPSSPNLHSGSSRAEQPDTLPPPIPCRSLPPASSSTSSPVPTEASVSAPSIQSTESRPQTLAIQPPTSNVGSVEVRKPSPVITEDKNIPPLPPKVLGPKGPPRLPHRVPALSPRTHR